MTTVLNQIEKKNSIIYHIILNLDNCLPENMFEFSATDSHSGPFKMKEKNVYRISVST